MLFVASCLIEARVVFSPPMRPNSDKAAKPRGKQQPAEQIAARNLLQGIEEGPSRQPEERDGKAKNAGKLPKRHCWRIGETLGR